MNKKKLSNQLLILFITISFTIKLVMILIYKNELNLASDDLNYIKCAIVLVKRGIFTFYGFNDPTVFVMPGYPLFLAGMFRIFGYGFLGIQAVRIVQAVISCITILMVYLIGKTLFNRKIGLVSSFLVSFYIPNIITAGYILTETIFTAFLCTLIYLSIKFADSIVTQSESSENLETVPKHKLAENSGSVPEFELSQNSETVPEFKLTKNSRTVPNFELVENSETVPNYKLEVRFIVLGVIWACITLIRPTIALYPVLLFLYLFVYHKFSIFKMIKLGSIMLITFIIIIMPWWIRNYTEYGAFIPLSASSGNPMLQGTYVNYKQTPENIVYYKIGKNTYETNKTEVETAKLRIARELKKDFFGYMGWFIVGKTIFFWATPFYWKEFFHIGTAFVFIYHYVILLGFIGIGYLIKNNLFKFILLISVILYFNVIHCYYMAFDRYAFPIMPLMTIFCSFILSKIYLSFRNNIIPYIKKDY